MDKNITRNKVKGMRRKSGTLLASLFLVTVYALADDSTDYYKSGVEKGQQRDFKGAIADFSKVIELSPNYAVAYNERGLAEGALVKKGDDSDSFLASALADYNKAIEINPDFAPAYYNRGVVMQAKGNWDNAKADFTKVVELKPNAALLAQAYYHLSDLFQREGNKNGAITLFAEACFYRGISESNKGETDSALADFNKTIELNPTYAQAYYNRGIMKEKKDDLDGALADYDKTIELNSKDANAYTNRGTVKGKKGDLNGALADFDKSIELNPNDANAYINRAIIKKNNGDLDGSLADQNKANELKAHKTE